MPTKKKAVKKAVKKVVKKVVKKPAKKAAKKKKQSLFFNFKHYAKCMRMWDELPTLRRLW